MPFKKGETPKGAKPFKEGKDNRRNMEGRPKKIPEIDVILAEVLGEDKDGITAAQAILMALRKKAASGDVRAAEVLLNRAYGMAKQSIENIGPPQKIIVERTLISEAKKAIQNGNGAH